ncbi:MAG: polysaccharide pyruvyl transferase family protein, partial [bacterium]|nr:polysaccharide pyruvyl transferase family protein [bacterium]
ASGYRDVDLFVVSGGTPIFDYYLLSRAFHFGVPLASGVPIALLGTGLKPIRSGFGRWFYRNILERARYIAVRDPEVREHISAVDRQVAFGVHRGTKEMEIHPALDELAGHVLRFRGLSGPKRPEQKDRGQNQETPGGGNSTHGAEITRPAADLSNDPHADFSGERGSAGT